MIGFFIVAGLLLVGALAFVVPPLLGKRLSKQSSISHDETNLAIYRDQLKELDNDLAAGTIDRLHFDTAKREIERRVLEEVEQEADRSASISGPKWTMAVGVAVLIPLIAIPSYVGLGTPAALDVQKLAARQDGAGEGGHDLSPQKIAGMVEQLKEKLKTQPEDADGWLMLAKTTGALARYEESANAYRAAARLRPKDAQLLADFADTMAMAQGRVLTGEPERLVAQALQVDPNNVKALALGGTIAFEKKDFAQAALLWKRILSIVPPDSEFAERIRVSVTEVENKAGLASSASAPELKPAPVVAAAASLSGRVDISPAAKKAVAPEDTVFIFARAATGPKMPLAILRVQAKDLPKLFELTEAMAMAPGMSISKFPELVVGARVSKSGNAIAQPGDWESELMPVRAGANGINLFVSKQIN